MAAKRKPERLESDDNTVVAVPTGNSDVAGGRGSGDGEEDDDDEKKGRQKKRLLGRLWCCAL